MWLGALKSVPDVALVGLVDLSVAQARARAAEFGLSHLPTGSDLKGMLQATAPDAVFDCTVPEAHYEVTLGALAAGCHVLGEKPISDDPDKAREMVAAAGRAGRVYAVIQNRRFDRNIRRLKRLLQTPDLGRVTEVHTDFYIGAHFGGFRDEMRHVLLKDMAIHTFDAARFLTDTDPVRVSCHEWNPAGSWYAHGASAAATFELTGGVVFTYRGSWAAEGFRTSWESEWRIVGERGSVRWDGGVGLKGEVVTGEGGFLSEYCPLELPPEEPAEMLEGHAGVIQNFVHALQTGDVPETVGTDNLKSLAMVFGAVESAETGRWVEIGRDEQRATSNEQ